MTERTIAELLADAERTGSAAARRAHRPARRRASGPWCPARRPGDRTGGSRGHHGPWRDPRFAGGPRRLAVRGRPRAPCRRPRLRRGRRHRPAPPPRSSRRRSRTSPVAQLVVADIRVRPRERRRLVVRRPERRPRGRRDHRHGRQDDDLVPRDGRARGRGHPTGMTGTAATRIGGVQVANEEHATTPEAPDLQRALAAMARRRRRRGGHRDDLARPGARPRRRDRLRRRDPDQPDPRAPRAPRHVGGVPRRQAAAVREAPRARAPAGRAPSRSAGPRPASSTPTTRRPERSSASPRRPAPGSSRTARTPPPTSGRRASRRTGDACASRTTPRPASAIARAPAGRPVQRPQRAGRRRPRRGGRPRPGRRPRGPRLAPARARADGADRRRAAVRGHRRLRPQPGLAPDGPRPARSAGRVARRRADRGLRVGRRARHGQAAGHGPDRRRARPDRGRHRRGPARRGP